MIAITDARYIILPVKFNMAAAAILNFLQKPHVWNGSKCHSKLKCRL